MRASYAHLQETLGERLRRVRLIALDLDGTTLTSDKRLTPRTVEAIQGARARGIEVAFATGRMLTSVSELAEEAGLEREHVTLNGSLVGRTPRDEPLFCGALGADLVARSRAHLPEGATLYWLTRRGVVTEAGGLDRWEYLRSWTAGRHQRTLGSLDEVASEPVYHLHWVGPREVLEGIAAELISPELQSMLFQSARGPLCHLEMRAVGLDKASGLGHLGRHLGVTLGETLVVGDWLNDLEMIQAAGVGLAMANACPPVREVADGVLPLANDEEGVADLLESVFLV